MKLTNPTDDQLNAAFAEKACGYFSNAVFTPKHSWCRKSSTGDIVVLDGLGALPDFIRSADTVLPWLENGSFYAKRNYFMASTEAPNTWFVHFCRWDEVEKKQCEGKAYATTFPRAAVIALLRAHGVEIEFTK